MWQLDYASALDCGVRGIKFASGGDAEWTVQSDKVKVGLTALRSGKITASSSAGCETWIEATVVGTGTLSFDWAVSCDEIKYACVSNALNGVFVAKIAEKSGHDAYETVTLTLTEATNVVRWTFKKEKDAYNEGNADAGQDRAWLDNLVWTPDAPVDFSEAVVTETTTPANLGITEGAFADEKPGSENLVKLVAWAQANGKTVAEVNTMTFSASGDPIGDDATAYLLNCAPGEIATESANFKVTSISVDGAGNVTVAPADGSAYGNGKVEVRYSATLTGEYTTEKPVGSQCFIKIYLVK